MTRVLVTGAGGYVGGRLVAALVGAGREVHAVVREPEPRLGVEQTVCDLASSDAIAPLAAACRHAEAVVHLAGENELLAAREPAAALASTVIATERVAEACAAAGVRRLVYMSTVHVYGVRMQPGATLSEDLRLEPRSVYAISRMASEHLAAALTAGRCELVVLRLSNSVGAPDDPRVDRWSLVANDLCRQGALGALLRLRSSGMQWRDFVPLSAVCQAIARACRPGGDVAPGTYNLASGVPVRVRDLAEMIQDAFQLHTGARPALEAPPPEPDPPQPYRVCTQRAADCGLVPAVALADAVSETVRFCLEHREEL